MLAQLNDCIGGLLHLRPNVITFRALLHLGPTVITNRTLLYLGQLLHLGLQHPSYENHFLSYFFLCFVFFWMKILILLFNILSIILFRCRRKKWVIMQSPACRKKKWAGADIGVGILEVVPSQSGEELDCE